MNTQTSPTAARAQGGRGALFLLCMAQFMLILDIAIVNVALPSIQRDLAFTPGELQLIVSLYALTFGGLLLLGGRIADVLGRKRLFLSGIVLFTLASLTCGLAPSKQILVVARAIQGIGGALVSPAALSLLVTLFPEGPARNRALGVWSAVAAGGGAAGLIIGGVLTDLTSWRWLFLVNTPIGCAVALASLWVLPESRGENAGQLDLAGAITVTAGFMLLVYGLGRVGQDGFGPITLLLLAAALVLLAAFVVIELRLQNPLVPFGLFRLPTLTGANLTTLLLSAVILGVNFFLTLYFQQVLHFSPLQTGLAFLPLTFASAVASTIAARVVGRWGVRPLLLIGMVALGAGALLLSQITPDGTYLLTVLPGMLLVAVGLGVGFTVGTLAATAGVSASQQGSASGIFNTSQQIGGALGLAVLTTVVSAATVRATGPTPEVLTAGFRAAFLVMTGFSLAAVVVVLALVRTVEGQQHVQPANKATSGEIGLACCHPHMASCQPALVQLLATQVEGQEMD